MGNCRREYSDEEKGAVMAALLEGQSISKVAEAYQIPRGTVAAWAGQVRGEGYSNPVATSKKERIGELIVENLEASLEATKAMAHVFADKEWIKKQNAAEIAVLYGVIQDKTFRILEALPHGDSE